MTEKQATVYTLMKQAIKKKQPQNTMKERDSNLQQTSKQSNLKKEAKKNLLVNKRINKRDMRRTCIVLQAQVKY